MTYAADFINYLKDKNLNTFTCKDVEKVTNCNSSHAVVRDIKKIIDFTYKWESNQNKKRFKRFYVKDFKLCR